MSDKDFRYEKDGVTIEAFQMTPALRYQEKRWPDWMDSRWLMTVDNDEWLNYKDKESLLPPLSWVSLNPDGTVTVRDAMEMESWSKVVPDTPPVIHPAADEGVAVQVAPGAIQPAAANDDGILTEVMVAFGLLKDDHIEAGISALQKTLSRRAVWCKCVPGQCADGDIIGCRQKSPLL